MAASAGLGSSFAQMPLGEVFTLSHLTPRVKSHLCRVYVTLTATLALATVGVLADIKYHLGGQITFLISLFGMLWLAATPPTKTNQTSRAGVLGSIAFSQGCSVGPLLDAVIDVHPAIIAWATAATSAVFLCFSLAALVAKRRSYLYLGGILSSAVMILSLMRIGGMLGFGLPLSLELYLGLAVFMGYVVFDTQMIVEKANRGDTDHVLHAMELFQDFVSIFVRLVVLLTQKEQNKTRKDKRRG